MAPIGSNSDPRSMWSSSLRPPLDLQPAVLPDDDSGDDDRAAAELLNAALEGDLFRVKKLMMDEAVEAAAVGAAGAKRRGPLHMAAANGNAEICRFLIKTCDVDVDAADSDGATPLIFAIQGRGSTTIVRLLLNNGANLNKADNSGVAPLHIAAERGFYEIAELLLSREAEVDLMCENGGAPIHIAAENGHAKMLELLLQHKANYNAGNPATALVIAAGKGFADCIKCLLVYGADANIPDEKGKLPVQIAACRRWKDCIEILFPVTTPMAEYATWSIDGIIEHEKSSEQLLLVSDLDDKENAASNKDTQPHQSKSCSSKGKALATLEENEGVETLMSGLKIISSAEKSKMQVLDLDDKENAASDDNTNKDTQPHQSKPCSEKGKALTTVEEKEGVETLMYGLKIVSSAEKSKMQVLELDDKENVASDDNTNKDTQPHQSKPCSEKGKALTTVEENGGIETLMPALKIVSSAEKSDDCSGTKDSPPHEAETALICLGGISGGGLHTERGRGGYRRRQRGLLDVLEESFHYNGRGGGGLRDILDEGVDHMWCRPSCPAEPSDISHASFKNATFRFARTIPLDRSHPASWSKKISEVLWKRKQTAKAATISKKTSTRRDLPKTDVKDIQAV